MRKGVQTYTVRAFFSDREQCRETYGKIAAIGYDSVQAGAPRFMTVGETQAMFEECGLANCSGNADYEKLIKGGDAITEAVSQARMFKTPYVGIGTIPEKYRYNRDAMKQYAHSLNGIASELKKEGCFLLYHHHTLEFYSFGGGVNGMDILADETDPEGVLFTLDTHWLAASGTDSVYWIRKLKGRVPIIHFKDYGISSTSDAMIEGVHKTFAEVGEGNIIWPPIVDACRETGVEFVIVEQDTCKGDPFDSLAVSYQNLCKLNI